VSQEMKLLEALCDALGFDIHITLDRQERKETHANAMKSNRGPGANVDRELLVESGGFGMKLDIDCDGMYTSYLRNPIISYKLSKRDETWRGKHNE